MRKKYLGMMLAIGMMAESVLVGAPGFSVASAQTVKSSQAKQNKALRGYYDDDDDDYDDYDDDDYDDDDYDDYDDDDDDDYDDDDYDDDDDFVDDSADGYDDESDYQGVDKSVMYFDSIDATVLEGNSTQVKYYIDTDKLAKNKNYDRNKVKFLMDDDDLATVTADDGSTISVSARKAGTCHLYLKYDGKTIDTFTITIKRKTVYAEKISIDANLVLKVGKTKKIHYKVMPGKAKLQGNIKWTSSNSKVAKVQSDGTVVAKKMGKCVITASVRGLKSVKCKVTVKRK